MEGAVFEWVCSDATSQIGLFESVGQPIHREVFCDVQSYLTVLQLVDELPDRCDAQLIDPEFSKSGWIRYVQKGLYVFNSWEGVDCNYEYRLLGRPSKPLHVQETSEVLSTWLRRITFGWSRFDRAKIGAPFHLAQPNDLR